MKTSFRLFALLFALLTLSTFSSSQWTHTNGLTGYSINTLFANEAALFAGTKRGIFFTSDNGSTWTAINNGLTDTSALSFTAIPKKTGGSLLFVGTAGGVFRSTNNGASWAASSTGLPTGNVNALFTVPTSVADTMLLFAGVYDFVTGGGIYRSVDSGKTWSAAKTGLTHNDVRSFVISANRAYLFAATYGGGVFSSTNNGLSWTAANTGLSNLVVASLAHCTAAMSSTNLFAATNGGGVYRSTNNGASWATVNNGITNMTINTVVVCSAGSAMDSAKVFAGSGWTGMYVSANSGIGWIRVNTGMTTSQINCLALGTSGVNIFAGTDDGVWRRSVAEMVTGIRQQDSRIPDQFSLEQNFPNPFNPSTIIEYHVPQASFVVIQIFDLLGRQVAVLVNEKKNAGTYSVQWNAAGEPAGIYFITMHAEKFRQTKKMILTK